MKGVRCRRGQPFCDAYSARMPAAAAYGMPRGATNSAPRCACREARLLQPQEAHVGRPAQEPKTLIERDGPGVGLVDVEHHLIEPAAAQVAQPCLGERGTQPEPAGVRIDPEHVDLADRVVVVLRLVIWSAALRRAA